MGRASKKFEHRANLLKHRFAIFSGFLSLRTGEPALADLVVQQALVKALAESARRDTRILVPEFSILVLKTAMRMLRGYPAMRMRSSDPRSALQAVLDDTRGLLKLRHPSTAMVKWVVQSFDRTHQRDLVRRALCRKTSSDIACHDAFAPHRTAVMILLRANLRLRIAILQRELAPDVTCLILYEQARRKMQRLFVEPEPGEVAIVVDDAYRERMLRYANGE